MIYLKRINFKNENILLMRSKNTLAITYSHALSLINTEIA